MASRWAVFAAALPLLALAGCSTSTTQPYTDLTQTPVTYDPPEPKPYVPAGSGGLPSFPVLTLPGANVTRPSAAAPPPAVVSAPSLRPGTQFVYETITESIEDAALGRLPVRTNATHGFRVLATTLELEGRPVVFGARLAHQDAHLAIVGGTTLDPATLAHRDLADLAWLNDCQEQPETCPTDLKEGLPSNATSRPKVPFPLRVGKEWTDGVFHQGLLGTWQCQVAAIDTTELLGGLDVVVRLGCTATFPMDLEKGSTFQTGAATLRWTGLYSTVLGTLVEERRVDEVRLHVEDLEGIHDFLSVSNRTVRLVDAILADGPEPDMVQLYDLLELKGRSLGMDLTPLSEFRYRTTVTTAEVPNTTVAWHLRDGADRILQQGHGRVFNISLEPGTYILRAEAVHHGKVLAFQELPLQRHLILHGDRDCEDVIVDVGVGETPAHGTCPDLEFDLRGQVDFIYVWFWGRGRSAGYLADEQMEIRDPRNVTVATGGWGYQDFWLEPQDSEGTWTLRAYPQAVHDASYRYEVIAIYDPLSPQRPEE